MTVIQDMAGIKQAAMELFVESLREDETGRVIDSLIQQDAGMEQIEKIAPRRTLATAYYDFAGYIIWLRGMLDSGVELAIMADEAEGLRALEAARQEFERGHPLCPQCRIRQYSPHPLRCRNSRCLMDFRRKN